MGKTQQAAGGGLTRADKAKLVPGNIREGVVLFEGTPHEIVGTAKIMPERARLSELGVTPVSKTYSVNTTFNYYRSSSSPAFDITPYKQVSFEGCSAYFNNAENLAEAGQGCCVMKDGVTVASAKGYNATVNVSDITGFVTFGFSAYTRALSSSGGTVTVNFNDAILVS